MPLDCELSYGPVLPQEGKGFCPLTFPSGNGGLMTAIIQSPLDRELKMVLFQQRRINRESLKLLSRFQSSSIQQCLPHRKNFLLPLRSMNPDQNQTGHAIAILQEVLQQIFYLFRARTSLDDWEQRHTEQFLLEIHQQLEYLEMLLKSEAEQKKSTLSHENLRLQVKIYFQRIRDYLENQEYCSCAWAIVHAEIHRCLFFVFRLTGMLSKQEMYP